MARTQASRTIAEGAAIRLWKRYGFRTVADLELEVLALARGVVVLEGRLDTADARLVRKGNAGLLRVNQAIREPGRKRFAIAHELGHFEIHADQTQLSACSSQDMIADYKGSLPEVEANWFAAELLMPRHLFAAQLGNAFPSFSVVRALASSFGTTVTATALRMVELSDDYCALVVSEGGRIGWWRANGGFRERYWLKSGGELSERSAAGAVFYGDSPDGEPVRISAVAWGGPEIETDWWEDVCVIDSYGQILSLIRAG